MKVTLLGCTDKAEETLIFTKQTRLNMSPSALAEIASWSRARQVNELEYMSKTIPSSWEFIDYIFIIEGVSRAFTHQFVRTRHGTYAQQSLRVVENADFDYVFTDRNLASPEAVAIINEVNDAIKRGYKKLLAVGQATEDARGILPTNIATNIVAKFNLRTMSELAKSRTGGRTQGEYQKVMSAMADAVIAVHPWAESFLFPQERDFFDEIEAFAETKFGGDLIAKGELLKIVDQMRKRKAL